MADDDPTKGKGTPPASGETDSEKAERENRERAQNEFLSRVRKESKEAAKEAFAEWHKENPQSNSGTHGSHPTRRKNLLEILLGP